MTDGNAGTPGDSDVGTSGLCDQGTPSLVPLDLTSVGQTPSGDKAPSAIDLRGVLAQARSRLPFCLRIMLEAQLRAANAAGVEALLGWTPDTPPFMVPMTVDRLIMPDSSGLPVLMDLAALRDRLRAEGLTGEWVEPHVPIDLVVDHSLIVDEAGHPGAASLNLVREYQRNAERYRFFKWAEQAFGAVRVVPPGTGIIHQVHLERLARLVSVTGMPRGATPQGPLAHPEFVLGCDSHTPMAGALGLLTWGVGGG